MSTADTGTSPQTGNTSPGFPSHTPSGAFPPRSAAQRVAPSVRAEGFRRQSPDLPVHDLSGASATRPVAVRRPMLLQKVAMVRGGGPSEPAAAPVLPI